MGDGENLTGPGPEQSDLPAGNQCGLTPPGLKIRNGAHAVPAGNNVATSLERPFFKFKYCGHLGPSQRTRSFGQDRWRGHLSKLGPRCNNRVQSMCPARKREFTGPETYP